MNAHFSSRDLRVYSEYPFDELREPSVNAFVDQTDHMTTLSIPLRAGLIVEIMLPHEDMIKIYETLKNYLYTSA